MGELDSLYMEVILDHYKFPRNRADLSHIADEYLHENPSCGDSFKLELVMGEDGKIERLCFDGHGCAISTASASLMSERLIGKTPEQARRLIEVFLRVLRGEESPESLEEWGDLKVLGGVTQFPLRVKCATLAWHAARKSLKSRAGDMPDYGTAKSMG